MSEDNQAGQDQNIHDARAASPSDFNLDFRKEFAYAALNKWTESEKIINRTIVWMLLAAVIFELVNRRLVGRISLSVLELNDIRLVGAFLLLILAYLYTYVCELVADVDWASSAYDAVMNTIFTDDKSGR